MVFSNSLQNTSAFLDEVHWLKRHDRRLHSHLIVYRLLLYTDLRTRNQIKRQPIEYREFIPVTRKS